MPVCMQGISDGVVHGLGGERGGRLPGRAARALWPSHSGISEHGPVRCCKARFTALFFQVRCAHDLYPPALCYRSGGSRGGGGGVHRSFMGRGEGRQGEARAARFSANAQK